MSVPNPYDNGLYDPMSNPSMGLAMGLLSAGGPSRMPVSLGQALAQGMQANQQNAALGMQRHLKLMIALQRLQEMTKARTAQQTGLAEPPIGGDTAQ